MYFWDHKFENVRLNEKIYVSKLSRAFVLQCVFDLEKFNVLIFFFTNFFSTFYEFTCQDIHEKIWQKQ